MYQLPPISSVFEHISQHKGTIPDQVSIQHVDQGSPWCTNRPISEPQFKDKPARPQVLSQNGQKSTKNAKKQLL